MANRTDLSWPQRLGIFDEESCRYFLHEIGSRFVHKFPFSFGMEEVYGQILEKYGFNGTPDVTSLLQELLEGEQNANGLGDDSDVWRPWRHSWRYRNNDALNPFIPRYGSIVLRPSTAIYIRRLRAANFIQNNEQRLTEASSPDKVDSFEDREPLKKTELPSLKRERTVMSAEMPCSCILNGGNVDRRRGRRPHSIGQIETSGSSSHIQNTSTTDIDPTISVLFQRFEEDRRIATQLRGGECISCFSAPCKETKPTVISQPGKDTSATPRQDKNDKDDQIGDTTLVGQKEDREVLSNASGEGNLADVVVEETSSPSLDEQQTSLDPEHKRRVVHRQARLIDGTIFTSKIRRARTICQAPSTFLVKSGPKSKSPSPSPNWSPVKKRGSLRSILAREFCHLFHRGKHNHALNFGRHCSVQPQSGISAVQNTPTKLMSRKRPAINSPLTGVQSINNQFGFDGAGDLPPSSSCLSPTSTYLNKPLPLNPEDIVRSMSVRSQFTDSQASGNISTLPSAASTTSSVSRTSSKKEFRGVARELLQPDMLTSHDLPPIHEVDANNIETDPLKSPVPPRSPVSYSEIAKRNPYASRPPSRSPPRPPPLDFSKLHPAGKTHVTSTDPEVPPRTDGYFSSILRPNPLCIRADEIGQQTRGRARATDDVPKPVQQENLPPKTPTKRSRSPIKRLFGLSKISSTNKIEESQTPIQPITPGSTTKDSLKRWGEKFRYGFLTPDQEQLRQEELIEAHNNPNNDSTTSTPNSTFPVSLDPPMQAKIQSEIELIMTVTANRYLMREAKAGRITAESVAKTKELWTKLNRPQVIEFHYDQITQHNLVMMNLGHVKLYGDSSKDAIAINSTMCGWRTLAREMSIRTFCSPDSVIRKHLHDAHRVLELLGAPLVTFLAYEDMQLKTLAKISQRQKERLDRRAGSTGRTPSSSTANTNSHKHRRNVSEGSYADYHDYSDYPITALQMDKISLSPSPTPVSKVKVRKATGAEGAVMSLPTNFERARDGYASNLKSARVPFTVKEI